MQAQLITINGKDYDLKFGYGAFRALGTIWKVPGIAEVGAIIAEAFKGLENNNSQSFSFHQMNIIAEMVLSAILAYNKEASKELTADDIATEVLQHPDTMVQIIETYMASISSMVAPQGKPKPRAKTRQKKK